MTQCTRNCISVTTNSHLPYFSLVIYFFITCISVTSYQYYFPTSATQIFTYMFEINVFVCICKRHQWFVTSGKVRDMCGRQLASNECNRAKSKNKTCQLHILIKTKECVSLGMKTFPLCIYLNNANTRTPTVSMTDIQIYMQSRDIFSSTITHF